MSAAAGAATRSKPSGNGRAGPPSDRAVDEAVRALLAPAEPVAVVRANPHRRTSHPLERLEVTLADGGRLELALKRLGRGARGGRMSQTRFVMDTQREAEVYARVLVDAPEGPPAHHGSWAGPSGERWLLVEWVGDGRELWQCELPAWTAAARWLGAFHTTLAAGVQRHAADGRLLVYDAAYYRRWPERALRFARKSRGRRSEAARFLAHLASAHDAVVETLLGLPATVVHGDFNAANVLVAPAPHGMRVAALDWELAAAGAGLVDLATLVSGGWADAERERLVAAYADSGVPPFTARELACARLHVALRWLGWAPPGWRPPPAQRHDWLADAVALARELGL